MNAATKQHYNSLPVIKHQEVPLDGGLPKLGTYLKNLSSSKAREHGEYVNRVLNAMYDLAVDLDYRYSAIDIKYTYVSKGKATCGIPGWHCDGNTWPLRGNQYFILTSPPCTEMIDQKLELDVWDGMRNEDLLKQIGEVDTIQLEPYTIYQYNCDRFHRGPVADFSGDRLLIRMCLSNYIRPK